MQVIEETLHCGSAVIVLKSMSDDEILAGDRIRFSQLGKVHLRKTAVQTGVVRKVIRDGRACIVRLDGRKGDVTLHQSYIVKDRD